MRNLLLLFTSTLTYSCLSLTTSICGGFVWKQVAQQAVQHRDMLVCSGFAVDVPFVVQLVVQLIHIEPN